MTFDLIVTLGIILTAAIMWFDARGEGKTAQRETDEHEALDDISKANEIVDQYKRDEKLRKAVDERFDG